MKNKNTVTATFAALFAQIIFGFSFMFTGVALRHASPMTVIANRYMVAFLGLTIVILLSKQKLNFTKNIFLLLLMSLFQPILYFVFETYGIKLTTSSFSGVMISMIPIVSMIMGIFTLGEKPSPMQYVFSALSVVGVIVSVQSGRADGIVNLSGVLLLIGAVLSSVGYNILSRKISSEFTAFERTYAMTLIGAIAFLVISLAENINSPFNIISSFASGQYVLSILYLGVFSSVIAFLLLNYANTYLPVAKTTVFSNLTTVVSVIAGTVFLKERITMQLVAAVCMIITGVAGVQLMDVKEQ